jgi:hypothetical protein
LVKREGKWYKPEERKGRWSRNILKENWVLGFMRGHYRACRINCVSMDKVPHNICNKHMYFGRRIKI